MSRKKIVPVPKIATPPKITGKNVSDLFAKKINGIPTDGQTALLTEFVTAQDGKEKYNALQNFISLTWPPFVSKWDIVAKPEGGSRIERVRSNLWNPWLERCLRAFTSTETAHIRGKNIFRGIILTGCGGAGKTHSAGLYAVAWWLPYRNSSIVTLTSTTKEMISQRIWPVINHYWSTAINCQTGKPYSVDGLIGDKVDSMKLIRASKGDDKHAIIAMAVAHGETQKAIQNIKGRHAPRMLLIIDEANGTPEAIFEVIPNMRKACADLTVIIIGNPGSRFDPHGRALTPENGWLSIDTDAEEWKTKAVPDWQLDSGIALRFDGYKSPNIKAEKTLFPYIYTCEDKENSESTPGYIGTYNYWVMERGLHPPEGTTKTIFTEAMFMRCLDTVESVFTWDEIPRWIAFLDPAFTTGGDSCFFHTGRVGLSNGKICLQLDDGFEFPISPDLESYDVDYQIARRVIDECRARKIAACDFGLDCTGTGRGVAAIIAGEWSSNIQQLYFGGSATSLASAQNDGRPGHEVYFNRVTQLWYNVQEAMEAGQVRGFSLTEKSQFCARLWDYKGRKYQIEPKDSMKARMRYSPDQADAVAGILHVAMTSCGLIIEGKSTQKAIQDWNNRSLVDVYGIGEVKESDGEKGWAEVASEYENTPSWA